jgi:hypothetical protein
MGIFSAATFIRHEKCTSSENTSGYNSNLMIRNHKATSELSRKIGKEYFSSGVEATV